MVDSSDDLLVRLAKENHYYFRYYYLGYLWTRVYGGLRLRGDGGDGYDGDYYYAED